MTSAAPTLTWPGKRPPAAAEPARLKAGERHGAAPHNVLIQGDNLPVLSALLPDYAGRVQLIYIDPPFATGDAFSAPLQVGDDKVRQVAYRDAWGDDFLQMMYDRLALMRELLTPDGSLFVHLDRRADSHVRLLLDELFGSDSLVNEIVWCFRQGGRSARAFSHKHHTIYWYARNAGAHYFDDAAVRVPYEGEGGYQTSGKGVTIKGKTYRPHPAGKVAEDWWDLPALPPLSAERRAFPTQKPEALLRRIIEAASRPGDLVADFFGGSGVTAAVAERTGRKWLTCDATPFAVHTTRKRLLELNAAFTLLHTETYNPAALRAEMDVTPEGACVRLCNIDFAGDKPWHDYLDYWAVDGAYDGEVFRPQWRAFRTRANPTPPLISAPLDLTGTVAVHAVSLFGEEGFVTL